MIFLHKEDGNISLKVAVKKVQMDSQDVGDSADSASIALLLDFD